MSAFPPHRSIPSISISQETALKFLSAYLTATKTSPHLLPNARLDPSGPIAGSSNSTITIHNLQRVEAGLRGEWVAPRLELEENNVPIVEGMDDGTTKPAGDMEAEGWMDLDDYQREQSIEGGDVAESGLKELGQEGDSDIEAVNQTDEEGQDGWPNKLDTAVEQDATKGSKKVKIAGAKVKTPKDKEARKKEKRARHKEEQKRKHEERLKQKRSEGE